MKLKDIIRLEELSKEELFECAYVVEKASYKIAEFYNHLHRESIYVRGIDRFGDLMERAGDIHYEVLDVWKKYEVVIKKRNLWNEYVAYVKEYGPSDMYANCNFLDYFTDRYGRTN